MAEATLPLFEWARNHEDYTGAVCWAILNRQKKAFLAIEALVDVDDFERLQHLNWRINRIGKNRMLRVVRGHEGEMIYLARELLGFPDGLIVDHRDRNSLNDRRRNLRACTTGENNLNCAGRASRTSRFKGVQWIPRRNKWIVLAGPRGSRKHYASFDTEIEAARAYNEFAKKQYGSTAYLNPV